MRKSIAVPALFLALAVLAGCGYYGRGISLPAQFSARDLPYAAGVPGEAALTLDVHAPTGAANLPVVVYVHGGGWTEGDKQQMDVWCRMIAARGYVVFNVNYRLAPRYPFPAAINDLLGALIFARDHAAEYGGDPSRIGIHGGSAGAHLAALAASAAAEPGWKPTGHQDRSAAGIVKASVLFFGVYDFNRPGLIRLTNLRQQFLGGKPRRLPEVYRLASPVNFVRPDLPPALLVCGGLDPILSQTRLYYRALRRAGARAELKLYPLQTHGFDVFMKSPAARDAFQRMMAFFDRELKKSP